MRTEVKIGLAVVLILAGVGAGYYVLNRGDDSKKGNNASASDQRSPAGTADRGHNRVSPSPGDVIRPGFGGVASASPSAMPHASFSPSPSPSASPAEVMGPVVTPPSIVGPLTSPSPSPSGSPMAIVPSFGPSGFGSGSPSPSPTPGSIVPPRPGATPTPSPTPASSGGPTEYVVVPGDSLWAIAAKVYKDGTQYKRIQDANPGVDSQSLHAGQKLKIPAAPAETAKTGTPTPSATPGPSAPAGGQIYEVQSGDSFSSIARKLYGDSKYYLVIQTANNGVDSSKLKIGQKLVIPPLEGHAAVTPRTTTAPSHTATPAPHVASARTTTPAPVVPVDRRFD